MSGVQPPPIKTPPRLLADPELSGFFKQLLQSVYLLFVQAKDLNPARISAGTATPEGAVTGAVGDLFLRTDGGASSTLYVKESGTGNAGWTAK